MSDLLAILCQAAQVRFDDSEDIDTARDALATARDLVDRLEAVVGPAV